MFSELDRLRPPAGRPCDNHVIGAWLSRQLICSESVLSRMLVERQWDYIVVSQQFAGNKRTFNGLVVKPESTLVIVEVKSTDVVKFTDVSGSSGETLNPLERDRFVWCRLEPVCDVRDRWRHGSSTGGSRRPWPRPSLSFFPVNLGRVDSRFVLGVHLSSRLLTWQTIDLPEGHVLRRISVSIIHLFCNFSGSFDF